jgi:putative membrane protein
MVDNNFIIKKSGFWDVSHEIIFPHKIQSISTFQYPWHKSVDIGHVSLHTAAGTINYKFGNYTQIKKMVNYWLYEVEKNNNQWI